MTNNAKRSVTRLATLAALAALLAPTAFAPAAHAAEPRAHEEAVIRQLFAEFTAALNSHDAHAVAALCTDDVDFIVISGADLRGRDAVEQHLQPLFAGRLKSMNRSATLQEVRFLRPDVAVVIGSYESSGVAAPDGAAAPPTKGVYDWVVVRHDGRWHISLWREANLPAPTPRP